MAAALRPTMLEDLGLLPTLRWYTKSLKNRYGLQVKLISRGLKGRLEQSFETTIYRICHPGGYFMSEAVRIRTMLLEDHKMVRQGLVALLQDAADIEIVGEAGDGATAVELARTLHPDVALLDISMPGMNGLEAAQKIREISPQTKLLFLTMYADDEYIIQALRFGGTGYVLKDADAGTLIDAVRRVCRGESYLSPEVSQTIIRRVINKEPETHTDNHENLTTRERQILQLIAEARTNREISERLKISIKTVQTHRANLMNKLDIHDQTSLVKYAIRHGLVKLE